MPAVHVRPPQLVEQHSWPVLQLLSLVHVLAQMLKRVEFMFGHTGWRIGKGRAASRRSQDEDKG